MKCSKSMLLDMHFEKITINNTFQLALHTPSLLCHFCEIVFPKDNQQLVRCQLREKLMKTLSGFSF